MKKRKTTVGGQTGQQKGAHRAWSPPRFGPGAWMPVVLLLALALVGLAACESAEDDGGASGTVSTSESSKKPSGDVKGRIGEDVQVGNAIITVRALEATFQPAVPEQRLSEEAPTALKAGESFYQAYVRVRNTGTAPIRVDPTDFFCAAGEAVVGIESTRSGPIPRSLLKNASLDLVLTFKAKAGFEPLLIYRPPWSDGVVAIRPGPEEGLTTTTR